MAQYDGSIRIGTGIDTKAFKAGSKEIETEARRMAKTVSSSLGDSAKIALQKQTDAFVKLNQQYANQEQKVKDLGSKLHDMQRQKVETDEFKKLSKDLDKAKVSLDRLYERRDSYVELGKKTPPKLELDISDAERKVRILEADIKELVYTNKAYLPVDTSKVQQEIAAAEQKQMQMYTALQTSADALTSKIAQSFETITDAEYMKQAEENIDRIIARLDEARQKEAEIQPEISEEPRYGKPIDYDSIQEYQQKVLELFGQITSEEERLAQIRENAVVGNQRIIETVERIKELEQEIADLKSAGVTEGYEDYDIRIQELEQLRQEVRDYNNGIEEVKESYSLLGQIAKKVLLFIGSSIKKSVVSSFQSLRKEIKNVISSMLSFGKSTKTSNNALQTGFKNILKYGLGIRSLYTLVNKLRTAIKEGFTNMANEVEGFKGKVDSLKASTLTLKNSFAAAFRPLVEIAIPYIQMVVDAMSNLLDMVGQFTAAIMGQKTYTKAIKQTTAAIEDENKAQNKQLSGLDKLNNLSSGSSGSADSGVSTQMFEENVPISSPMLDMYQNLKDLIESEDWEGLGAYIAGALNQGLQKIYDVINWDNVGPQITYFVTAFTGAFNGLVDGFNWELLGQTIGAGINTIVNSLTLIISGIDWVSLGAGLATGLNGLANEVDFTNVGNLIGLKFMVLPSILLGFVTNLDWAAIGDQIGNALNGVVGAIDLSQIGTLLGTSLTGIFQMAINFAATFDWEALGTNIFQGINAFFASTDWATVGQGISDFAMGLLDALLVAVSGIDWGELGKSIIEFILAIDWLGLVVKLAEIGYQLIYGLCDGILGALAAIGTWLKENVFDPIVGWFKDLFGIHSPSTVFAELGTYLIEGLFIGISSLVDTIKEIWAGMKDTAVSIWTAVKEKISNIVSNIKSVISSALMLIKTIWSTSWTMVRTIATQVWTGIKQSISSIINSVKTVISTALTLIKKTWDTAWTGMKNTVVNIFNAIWSAIKGVINSILGGIEGMANGVINGVNSVIKALNGLSFTIPATPFSDAMTIGLNIPSLSNISIPRLATGTVVPPNNEFMAVLGDNKREPEIVSPISTMKQAFLEAIAEAGDINGNRDINLQLTVECEGYKLLQLIQKLDLAQYKRTGRPSFRV